MLRRFKRPDLLALAIIKTGKIPRYKIRMLRSRLIFAAQGSINQANREAFTSRVNQLLDANTKKMTIEPGELSEEDALRGYSWPVNITIERLPPSEQRNTHESASTASLSTSADGACLQSDP